MKLDNDISLENFRDEMQHRVVKYPLRSRPVREGLRFAKRHSDAAFHRVATDKIHAQKQFQRELNGPSKFERFVDFLTLGSLREVFVMMLLVVSGIAGVEAVKSAYSAMAPPEPAVDIDALAEKLNLGFENRTSDRSSIHRDRSSSTNSGPTQPSSVVTERDRKIDALAAKIAAILIENKELSTLSVETNLSETSQANPPQPSNKIVNAISATEVASTNLEVVNIPKETPSNTLGGATTITKVVSASASDKAVRNE